MSTFNKEQSSSLPEKISRRNLLKLFFAGVLTGTLAACTKTTENLFSSSTETPTSSPLPTNTVLPTQELVAATTQEAPQLDTLAYLKKNGSKFPADQISIINKPLSEWTAEEKTITKNKTAIYEEIRKMSDSDWVKANDLELVSVFIDQNYTYSALYQVKSGNYAGHLTWATNAENKPLSQPDGTGLGVNVNIIPKVQASGLPAILIGNEQRLVWINSSGDILYVYDALRNQWVQKAAFLHGYQDAEKEAFTGNFSEKYPVSGITVNLTAEITEGLSIPISYKFDLGFTDIQFKQEYVDALGKQFLYRCYQQNGDMTLSFDQFIEQVKQDKIRVQQVLFDERTGAKIIGWFDPKQGYSNAQSFKNLNLPYAMVKNPYDSSQNVNDYYVTKNDNGRLIEINQNQLQYLPDYLEHAGEYYKTDDTKKQFELFLEGSLVWGIGMAISGSTGENCFMKETCNQTEQKIFASTEIYNSVAENNTANKNEWITISNFDPSLLVGANK